MPYNVYDIGPQRYQAQQQGRQDDFIRMMMRMMMMAKQMKGQKEQQQWQRGMEEKRFGVYEQTQQDIQARNKAQLEAFQQQKRLSDFQYNTAMEKKTKLDDLVANATEEQKPWIEFWVTTGKDPRMIELKHDISEQELKNARLMYEKIGQDITSAKVWGGMPPELAIQAAMASLQPLQASYGQLQQTLSQMGMYDAKSKEYKALSTRYANDYQIHLKTYPQLGQDPRRWVWEALDTATPGLNLSKQYEQYSGPSHLQSAYDQIVSPAQAGDKLKKAEQQDKAEKTFLKNWLGGAVEFGKQAIGKGGGEKPSVVPAAQDTYSPSKAVIYVTDALKKKRKVEPDFSMMDLVGLLQELDEGGKTGFETKHGINVDYLIKFIMDKMISQPKQSTQ